jgi:hypothetical protein
MLTAPDGVSAVTAVVLLSCTASSGLSLQIEQADATWRQQSTASHAGQRPGGAPSAALPDLTRDSD